MHKTTEKKTLFILFFSSPVPIETLRNMFLLRERTTRKKDSVADDRNWCNLTLFRVAMSNYTTFESSACRHEAALYYFFVVFFFTSLCHVALFPNFEISTLVGDDFGFFFAAQFFLLFLRWFRWATAVCHEHSTLFSSFSVCSKYTQHHHRQSLNLGFGISH